MKTFLIAVGAFYLGAIVSSFTFYFFAYRKIRSEFFDYIGGINEELFEKLLEQFLQDSDRNRSNRKA